MIVNVQKETSKHTIVKGSCVFKQRDSLRCVGLLCECSRSFRSVALKEVQHGLTSLFSSFIFQYGRLRSVTCQRCLYYFGEAQEKKKCLGVFPYRWMLQCGLCSQKNVEISRCFFFFFYRYFPYFIYSNLSFRWCAMRRRVFFFRSGHRPG